MDGFAAQPFAALYRESASEAGDGRRAAGGSGTVSALCDPHPGARLRFWGAKREELSGMTDSGTRDRAEGMTEEAKGKAKQAWGDMTDDERMKAEGMLDEAKGKTQQAWGDLKDKAEDVKDDIDRKI